MKKKDFIDQVAEKAEMSKAAAGKAIEAIFDATSGAIAEAVRAGEHISLPGFGRFRAKKRPARKGRNPQTGAEIDIPERTVLQFSAAKGLHETLTGSERRATRGARKSGGAAKGAGSKRAGGGAKSGGSAAKSGGGGAKASAAKGGGAKAGGSKSAGAKSGGAKSGGGAKKSASKSRAGGAAKGAGSKS